MIQECATPRGKFSYIAEGHIDSHEFRNLCEKEFFERPRKVNHIWMRRARKPIVTGKRKRSTITDVLCEAHLPGAIPYTVGE